MKRNHRAECARDTLTILDRGYYETEHGSKIELHSLIGAAVSGSKLYTESTLKRTEALTVPSQPTCFTLSRQSTLEAMASMAVTSDSPLACLNFASAKNPGGGFLGGSQAQEESLARSSGLYPCLLTQESYYKQNRANCSALYLDLAIFSPLVPFFKDDAGELLANPYLASVITCPAPNAGAIHANEPESIPQIESTLRRRIEFVLRIAAREGIKRLILGAWGCGVFRNSPARVAAIFAETFHQSNHFGNHFEEVRFAIYDPTTTAHTYQAFKEALAPLQITELT